MNFKVIVALLFIMIGCGVKGPPEAPPGTKIPSLYQKYLTATPTPTPSPTDTVTTVPTSAQ